MLIIITKCWRILKKEKSFVPIMLSTTSRPSTRRASFAEAIDIVCSSPRGDPSYCKAEKILDKGDGSYILSDVALTALNFDWEIFPTAEFKVDIKSSRKNLSIWNEISRKIRLSAFWNTRGICLSQFMINGTESRLSQHRSLCVIRRYATWL